MAYAAPAARPSGAAQRPEPVAQFAKDSVAITGITSAGPTANTVVATITPAVAGVYSIQINAGYGLGAVAAVENANMRLRVDGTVLGTALPVVAAQNVMVGCGTFILTVNGSQAVDVQ